jgi:uroporphyrinogen decarboxylase
MPTSRELVYEALEFKKVPRVPFAIGFTVHAKEQLLAHPGGRELFEKLDNDTAGASATKPDVAVPGTPGHFRDEFGVVWDRTRDADIGIPHPLITPENFPQFKFPDPNEKGRFDDLANSLKNSPDKFQIMYIGFSLFERAWTLRGMENLFMDFVEDEGFVSELLDKIINFNVALVQAGLKACPNIDGVYFGDDFGSQTGLMMGAERWRKFLKPRLAKQYGAVRAAGKKVFIHSCGKVQEIFDDLVEIGVNCFNPFQPEVMDVYEMLKRYRGKLAFHGGVSTQKLLPYGSVREVETEVEKLLAAGRNGGYIIAPAHATPGDAKPENIAAMLKKVLFQS